mgnify:CR=1
MEKEATGNIIWAILFFLAFIYGTIFGLVYTISSAIDRNAQAIQYQTEVIRLTK